MKRTALDAFGFFACLGAILSLLFVPTAARPTDDHNMAEVQRLLGSPSKYEHSTCGGSLNQYGKRIATWPCTVWRYPVDDGELVIYFHTKLDRASTATVWIDSTRSYATKPQSDEATRLLHEALHEAREKAPVKNSSSKKGRDT
jgi:hypothetical protein